MLRHHIVARFLTSLSHLSESKRRLIVKKYLFYSLNIYVIYKRLVSLTKRVSIFKVSNKYAKVVFGYKKR